MPSDTVTDGTPQNYREDHTVPVEVTFQNGEPAAIDYHHPTFGLIKLTVEGDVATLDPKWDRLNSRHLKDGFEQWITTGDVLRSVLQLPFINSIEVGE